MRLLSIAERELRAAARRPGLYRLRWTTVAAFIILLLWLSWVFDLFQNRGAGPEVFQAFSVVTFLFCLFVGATGTADCISREKREGTLGLLFLTNLNSAEIVAGKLCSNALAAFYSLLAIFPVLALPVLIGGITFGHFWRMVLALVNTLFFAIAAGFVASALSVRQFPLLTVVLVVITVAVTAPYFGQVIGAGAISPLVGHLFAWLCTGLVLHALVLYYGATVASQRLE